MTIRAIPIPKELIESSSLIFQNKIVKECFEKEMWIAGGFARKVGHLLLDLNNVSASNNYLLKYLDPGAFFTNTKNKNQGNRYGDIDFFTSDQDNIFVITSPYTLGTQKLPPRKANTYYSRGTFSDNLHHNVSNESLNNNINIKIQLVRKFCFDSIESCFDSFDITNSKYAISKPKNGNHYVLHYDDEALKYDSMRMLHINHSNTPYLSSRIVKYLKYRGLKSISCDDNTTNNFNEYLYKCTSNKWDNLFNVDGGFMESSIKALDKVRKLSDIELSIFIGKISCNIASSVKTLGTYGVYVSTTYEKGDWATHRILERV